MHVYPKHRLPSAINTQKKEKKTTNEDDNIIGII